MKTEHPRTAAENLNAKAQRRKDARQTRSFPAPLRLCVFALILLPLCLSAATNDLSSALQKGLFEEEANRNLDAAIQAYQSVAARFDKDRQLAATAIFRLGECYRKLGKTNEATAQYERIVREFSDQNTLVTLSRQNLAGMGATQIQAPSGSARQQSDAQAEAASLLAQIKELKGLSPAKRRIAIQQSFPNPLLTSLMQDLSRAEQNLVSARNDFGPDHPQVKKATAVLDTINKQIDTQLEGAMTGLEIKAAAALQAAQASSEKNVAGSDNDALATTDEEEKEIRRIREMIRNSPDLINAKGADGETPLVSAAKRGQLKVVQFLLDNGAYLKGQSRALNLAALNGHKAVVELLLNRGADVNAIDSDGLTPLHQAASRGFKSVAEVLLAHKADVKARNSKSRNSGETPLHSAALSGQTALVELLLANGADANATTDNLDQSVLSYAAITDHLEVVRALLEAKANPNLGKINLPLHCAISQSNARMLDVLLRAGADPDSECKVTWKVKGRSEIPGGIASVTPLALAAFEGKLDAAKLLLAAKANPNCVGVDGLPVIFSCLENAKMTASLLEAGAKADAKNNTGQTPMQIATSDGNKEIVELLLANKADPNSADANGYTPLMNAVINLKADTVRVLLANGANPNILRLDGFSVLTMAMTERQNKEVVAALIEAKANVNAADPTGKTPLHYAVNLRRNDFVELLLDAGANPNIRDNSGKTPFDVAKESSASGNVRPGIPVGLPPLPIRAPRQPGTQSEPQPTDIATLLRQHGALEWIPRPGEITVTRRSTGVAKTVFQQGTNLLNRFTLLEAIAALPWGPTGGSYVGTPGARNPATVPFPDFSKVTITHRDPKTGKLTNLPVDVAGLTADGDCSKDFPLDWGDLVDIPDTEHKLNEQWLGLPTEFAKSLVKCLERKVVVEVKSEPQTISLGAIVLDTHNQQALAAKSDQVSYIVLPFRLKDVLNGRAQLFSTSDLTRVKVRRVDPGAGRTNEWLFNAMTVDPTNDLWLRDGDVIEVPDKP